MLLFANSWPDPSIQIKNDLFGDSTPILDRVENYEEHYCWNILKIIFNQMFSKSLKPEF